MQFIQWNWWNMDHSYSQSLCWNNANHSMKQPGILLMNNDITRFHKVYVGIVQLFQWNWWKMTSLLFTRWKMTSLLFTRWKMTSILFPKFTLRQCSSFSGTVCNPDENSCSQNSHSDSADHLLRYCSSFTGTVWNPSDEKWHQSCSQSSRWDSAAHSVEQWNPDDDKWYHLCSQNSHRDSAALWMELMKNDIALVHKVHIEIMQPI